MRRKDIDWRIIRGALVSLVLSIAVSSSLVAGSNYFKQRMNKEFIRNDALFKNISQRYLAIDEEAKRIEKYFPKFVELYHRGVIGEEQRLNWVEVLQKAEKRLKLPGLSYIISTQKAYAPSYPITMGSYKLYASEMTLDLQLLHEGDFFRLLNMLNSEAKGVYNLTSCNFDVAAKGIVEKPDAANVRVSCELEWYTIKLSSGKEIKI